jgi:hypothetical protein
VTLRELLGSLDESIIGLLFYFVFPKLLARYWKVEGQTEEKLLQEVREVLYAEFRRDTGPEQMKMLQERIAQLEMKMDLIQKAANVMME